MLPTTLDATRALLRADPILTPADRAAVLEAIRDHGRPKTPEPAPAPQERIVRRGEAAKLLGCTTRTVDNWTAAGILHKVMLPGHRRASGFRLSEVMALIQGESIARGERAGA